MKINKPIFAQIPLATLLLVFCLINSNGQDIGVQGSTWYYTKAYHPIEYPIWGFIKITYVRDTIISNDTAKLFLAIEDPPEVWVEGRIDTILIFEEDQKVFYQWNNKLGLLYDFGVNNGDTIVYDMPFYAADFVGDTTFTMVIDSIKTEVVDDKELRTIYQSRLEDHPSYYVYFNKISERLGNWDYLLPQPMPIDYDLDLITGIRCYQDVEFQYKTYAEVPCDTIIFTSSHLDLDNSFAIKAFPNYKLGDLFELKVGKTQKIDISESALRDLKFYGKLGFIHFKGAKRVTRKSSLTRELYSWEKLYRARFQITQKAKDYVAFARL